MSVAYSDEGLLAHIRTSTPFLQHLPNGKADAITAGSVAKDGSYAAIEFVAGEHRLWVTIPIAELDHLQKLCLDLRSVGHDAKNGLANRWLVNVGATAA